MTELRLQGMAREVNLAMHDLDAESRKKLVLQAARENLEEAQKINGTGVPFTTIVDGQRGAAITNVRDGGVIVYLFNSAVQAVVATLSALRQNAPRKSGRYASSFVVLINGTQASPPYDVQITDTVTFTNLQPYARKIEQGLSSQSPNGVFEVVARQIRREFGSFLSVKFTYRSFVGGKGKNLRYPSIILTVKNLA